MTSPLRIEFDVDCSAAHAFETWTSRIATWWPSDHTVSGDPKAVVVLEPRVGGRIYERSTLGLEHDWGTVTAWEPPRRLAYSWHLGRDPRDATDVEIRFVILDPGRARVEIEHRGWERLGERAESWRDRNRSGWEGLLPHLVAAIREEWQQ
jgi:uncharacterized protein YndB with AHSA1/START domain